MNTRKDKAAFLILEDGSVYDGTGFGSKSDSKGEVVFTTAMNGYVESLTDPSFMGQILVITHPLVGNYGVPKPIRKNGILSNFESGSIKVKGLVISELTKGHEWNSERSLEQWFEDEKVSGISGIDTRELTLRIREKGTMSGIISSEKNKNDFEDYEKINFVEMASIKKPVFYENKGPVVVMVDYGAKEGILEQLYSLGYSIARVPYNYSEEKIMDYEPKAIVLSNGPGNPMLLHKEAETIGKLMEYKIPILGICLGHQLMAMALGMEVKKMPFGHRSINKGVIDLRDGSCMITTHNHGYAAYGKPEEPFEISHVSLDDKTVEGIRCIKKNIIGVQFHPEARPGAKDGERVFSEFNRLVDAYAKK